MVREVKFASDELNGIELPLTRDRFDDEDDEVLEGLTRERREGRSANAEPRRGNVRRAANESKPGRRHLAGADWLEAVPELRRRRPQASA